MPLITTCALCKKDFSGVLVKCDRCCMLIHQSCSELTDEEVAVLQIQHRNLVYLCDSCTEEKIVRDLVNKLRGIVLTMKAEVEKVKSTRSPPEERTEPAPPAELELHKPTVKTCTLSPELATLVGAESLPRQEVLQKVLTIIKDNNLHDPKNKQFVNCNDQLLKVIGKRRFRAYGLMKYLKKHFID